MGRNVLGCAFYNLKWLTFMGRNVLGCAFYNVKWPTFMGKNVLPFSVRNSITNINQKLTRVCIVSLLSTGKLQIISDEPTLLGPWSLNCYVRSFTTINKRTRSNQVQRAYMYALRDPRGPYGRDPDGGGVHENGTYGASISENRKVWEAAVIFVNRRSPHFV